MRREHDSLGEMDVPTEALYGIQTQRAIENFPISGLPPRAEFVEAIVLVKKAAAQVNFSRKTFTLKRERRWME